MASLREEYREVTDALERAYQADMAAYAALPRRSKDFWALQPPQSWPTAPEFAPWIAARVALLEAEQRVIKMLRTRCEMIRQRLGHAGTEALLRRPHHPAYMEQIVDTVPDDLHLADYMRLPVIGEELVVSSDRLLAQTH